MDRFKSDHTITARQHFFGIFFIISIKQTFDRNKNMNILGSLKKKLQKAARSFAESPSSGTDSNIVAIAS